MQTSSSTDFRQTSENQLMPTIIIFEDDPDHAVQYQNKLQRLGHTVHVIQNAIAPDAIQELVDFLQNQIPQDQPADFLVLDLDVGDDQWAGIRAYAAILERGLRRRFKHLLVQSKWVDRPGHQAWYVIQGFCLAALVNRDNLLSKSVDRVQALQQRVNQLAGIDPIIVVAQHW